MKPKISHVYRFWVQGRVSAIYVTAETVWAVRRWLDNEGLVLRNDLVEDMGDARDYVIPTARNNGR